MKDALLFICAAGALVAFGVIFFLALAEQRAADPMGQANGDVPAGADDLKLFHASQPIGGAQHDHA